VTAFPATGVSFEVSSVTTICVPKSPTGAGDVVATVDALGDTANVPNVTEGVAESGRFGVTLVSVAVNVTVSTAVSVAVNVATPELFVTFEPAASGCITTLALGPWLFAPAMVTVWPETGCGVVA
jgi:hypothetical protein